jgi:phage repressor protein C with HTH and peptisase S24 domain
MPQAKLMGNKIKEYFSEIGMSQTEVAAVLDVQQAAVSNQLNGRRFGKNNAAKWSKAFGFRANWLITGEGPMFDADNPNAPREYYLEEHPELNHDDDIPVIPARLFRAPDIDIYEYVMTSQSVEKLPPVPHFQKHELFATCPGDAMAPRLCRGYLLALRKIQDDVPIINGEIYVVDTRSSGMFLRRLVDNGNGLTLIAENQQDFPDFDIEYTDVINVFRVVGALIPNL